jgi:hypothetical protein
MNKPEFDKKIFLLIERVTAVIMGLAFIKILHLLIIINQ